MIDTKGLRSDRAKLFADAEKLASKAHSEKRSMTAEEQEQFDRMMNAGEELKRSIDSYEALNAAQATLAEADNPASIGREDRIVEVKLDKPTRQLEAYRSLLVNGFDEMPFDLRSEIRSDVTLLDTNGYTAPDLVNNQYIEYLRDNTDIRKSPVYEFTTANGNTIPFPVLNDDNVDFNGSAYETDEYGVKITEEGDYVGDAREFHVDQITLSNYMVTSGILRATRQFLRDSTFPAEQWLNQKLAQRIGMKQNRLFTTGSGTGEPQGLVTGVYAVESRRVTLSSGHASSLGVGSSGTDYAGAAKDLVNTLNNAIHKVAPQYRVQGKTGFTMHDSTIKSLKNYVDSTGRLLWQAGLAVGAPDTILNYPIFVNNAMAELGANAKSVVFGNFGEFYIRNVGSLAVDRLVERYAEYLMIGFNGYHAVDSRVMNPYAFSIIVNSAS